MLCTCCTWIALATATWLAVFKAYIKLTSGRYRIPPGLSLHGKTVLITGANTGIGKETALAIAKLGAKVILACRSIPRGSEACKEIVEATGNKDVEVMQVDVSNLDSIRTFVKEYTSSGRQLHILINNAGMSKGENALQMTADGMELTMQTNHFGPFLLTNLLLPLLRKNAPSRIVNVASHAHTFYNFDIDNLNYQKGGFSAFKAYCVSKLCNILFTRELSRRLQNTGVTTNSLHPGAVRTELGRNLPRILVPFWAFASLFLKSAEDGAQTTLFLALSPSLEHVSGHYFSDCVPTATVLATLDDGNAEKLWSISEKLTGLA